MWESKERRSFEKDVLKEKGGCRRCIERGSC
jgi:hypothetical protein